MSKRNRIIEVFSAYWPVVLWITVIVVTSIGVTINSNDIRKEKKRFEESIIVETHVQGQGYFKDATPEVCRITLIDSDGVVWYYRASSSENFYKFCNLEK